MLKHKKDILINDNALVEVFSAISRVSLLENKPDKQMPLEGSDHF
jgi:hypothetical protein